MDLYKLLKIKVYNRLEFTLYIFVIVFLTHLIVLLINGLLKEDIFYYLGSTHLLFKGLKNIYLHQNNIDYYWAPDAITIAIVTLFTIWGITLGWQLIIFIYKWIFSPVKWESKDGFPQDCFNDVVYQGEIEKRDDNTISLTDSGGGFY